MTFSANPFEEGDRVDHRIFGFGTVNGAPKAMVSPDMSSRSGVRDAGWCIPIRWDDPSRTAGAVMHHALRKVASAESRPFTYWDRQWQLLFHDWVAARRDVEQALSNFRPAPALADMAKLQNAEERALEAMLRFLDEERSGKHP